jgi:2-polyprenyl-6-methoxyphenol hydroxylase-like FAD-dependent oxidoreductase
MGIDVRIVDRAPERSLTSRALGIQARTVELLRVRGVGDELVRLGNPARATALYSDGAKLAAIELDRMPSEFNYVLLLAQSDTERLLTEQLNRQGVKIERGFELIGLAQRPNGVSATLRSGDSAEETVDASYLIAADGSHSAIRKALGLPFTGRSLTHNYVLGDVHLAGDVPQDQLSIFLARNGFLAVFPMGDGRFRFMATDPDGITGDSGDPTLEEIQRLYNRTVHLPAQLYNLNWSSRFRINSRHMTSLRDGRVFFGGDAAHVHSPAGGQGMNAGIQDMINLSWKLAMVLNGQARHELLDTYQSDRLPVIRQLVRMTERATKPFNSTNPPYARGHHPARPDRVGPRSGAEQGCAATRTTGRELSGLSNCQGRRTDRIAASGRPRSRSAHWRPSALRPARSVHADSVRHWRPRPRGLSAVARHRRASSGVDRRHAIRLAVGPPRRLPRGRRRTG